MKVRLILLLVLSIFCFSAIAKDGKILFVKGKAMVNGVLAKKGASISFGDKVNSGKDSLVVIKLDPGVILKLKTEASIIIEKPVLEKKSTLYGYIVEVGEVFVKAKKTKINRFNIKAKNSVLGIRGTQFFVAVPKKTGVATWMCVNEGLVSVKLDNVKGDVLVKAGEGVAIGSKKLPEVKKYNWTKGLNWKMEGSFSEIEDKTDLSNINYDLKKFNYD